MSVLTSHHAAHPNGAANPTTSLPPGAPASQMTPPGVPAPRAAVGFHGAVGEFKRRLIEATLAQFGGNRTRTAKALGLQRTYLLRLMREFEVGMPAAANPRQSTTTGDAPGEAPPPKHVDTQSRPV